VCSIPFEQCTLISTALTREEKPRAGALLSSKEKGRIRRKESEGSLVAANQPSPLTEGIDHTGKETPFLFKKKEESN
jgi:hypothetical protein